MFRTTGRAAAALMVGSAMLTVGLGASAAAKTAKVKVDINDDGCPAKLTIKAGPTNFKVTNSGSGDVSEFEILSGDSIIGEVENVAPGLNKEFSLTLKAGTYTTQCPGGSEHADGKLVVTGAATKLSAAGKAAVDAVPPVPRGPDRRAGHHDQGVHRRGRRREPRAGEGALRTVASRLRADRTGGGDVRRPRRRDRRARRRRAEAGMGRVPLPGEEALGRRHHRRPLLATPRT